MEMFDQVWMMILQAIAGFFITQACTAICLCGTAGQVAFAKPVARRNMSSRVRKICTGWICQGFCVLTVVGLLLPISFALSDICEVMDSTVTDKAYYEKYSKPLGDEFSQKLELCLYGDG